MSGEPTQIGYIKYNLTSTDDHLTQLGTDKNQNEVASNSRNIAFQSSGGQKSKVKMLARSVAVED